MYKQLQKKQMSQLKEAMKEKKDTKKKSKQDITTEHHEDATHDAPLPPVSGSHDPATMSTSITVEITMCSLTASDLEVCRIVIGFWLEPFDTLSVQCNCITNAFLCLMFPS